MVNRWTLVIGSMVMALAVASSVFGEPKAKGRGQQPGVEQNAQKAAERVANEAIDAVADEVAGNTGRPIAGAMPPGLAKKDRMPPGLAKQDKIPPGWEKGKKTGWEESPQHESLIRRTIRKIFRGNQPAN